MKLDPSNITEALQSALKLYQGGQLQQAAEICDQILTLEPNNIHVLHLLGVISNQRGNYQAGIKFIRQAIELKKDYGDAYFSLGNICASRNNLDDAVENYSTALSFKPGAPEILFNLANTYKEKEEPDKAVTFYQRAISLKPDYVKAHINLGVAYLEQGDVDNAVKTFQKALFYDRGSFEALNNLGNILRKRGLYGEAGHYFRQALSRDPHNAVIHYNIGVILEDQGKLDQAEESYRKAFTLRPDYIEAYNSLGDLYIRRGLPSKAEATYKEAIRRQEDSATSFKNLADAFKEQGRLQLALEWYRKALLLKDDYHTCHSELLLSLNYLPEISQAEIYSESLKWAARHATAKVGSSGCFRDVTKDGARLRVGYVSPDFKRHSMVAFIEPLVRGHNRRNVEVFLFSNVSRPDEITGRIKAQAENWLSIAGRNDDEVADEIRRNKIDILVDLTGHTGEGRLLLFARKPAQVQVTWLGYVNTTGLAAYDYFLADATSVPVGDDELYTESVFRLPRCFFCYQPPGTDLPVGESPVNHVGRITYGSLNNLVKINPQVIDLWAQILKKSENSHLVMVNKQFADDNVRNRYMEKFVSRDIGEERIEMIPGLPHADFLAVHNKIDIALDPFPFNGLFTSCDSLRMGVPVITLRGRNFAGRMGASLMTSMGLQELVAENRQDYVQKAVSLAEDINRLNALRKTTRQRLYESPVCDIPQFVGSLESAYFKML